MVHLPARGEQADLEAFDRTGVRTRIPARAMRVPGIPFVEHVTRQIDHLTSDRVGGRDRPRGRDDHHHQDRNCLYALHLCHSSPRPHNGNGRPNVVSVRMASPMSLTALRLPHVVRARSRCSFVMCMYADTRLNFDVISSSVIGVLTCPAGALRTPPKESQLFS